MSAVCRILLFAATFALTLSAFAQDRCGADLFEKKALLKNPQQRADFESWMKKKTAERKSGNYARTKVNNTYQIPVVVHIIHNGEQIGSGSNLSDAQVQSQIRVLNEDYKRMNADAVNTPAEFAGVASSIDIEFVLAKQDPDGLPTTGITRTLGSKNGYRAYDDNSEIKAQSYWPSSDYLNIWVTNLIDEYLGVAQYPVTDLSGTVGPYDAITDGVVIHYKAFGSIEDGAFNLSAKYNLGRTTTHEIGHFLGLLHVFGDFNGCNTTDYVNDTPVQSDRTFSCPTGALTQCGHHVMYQNYMDYTDDACMNLFTAGQIDRMITVLENSPRRTSLLSSHGLTEPTVYDLDLEAKNIAAPAAITCGEDIVPRLVIRNRGETTINTAKISFSVNGSVVETKDFTLNLPSFESTTVSFASIDLAEPSSNAIAYNILEVNGVADDNTGNDETTLTADVKIRLIPPAFEAFNSTPADWQIVNPDGNTTWENITAPKSNTSNKAMYVDFYDYQNLAQKDLLISPYYSVPQASALLKFDHAYAQFVNIDTETLRVLISVGCSADLADAIEIYSKTGPDLATASVQSTPFVPKNDTQWTSSGISLVPYAGQNIQLIFESTNQNGNNLYLDNVQISTGDLNDMKIVSVVSPGPVFCESKPRPVIAVQNLGTDIVTSLKVTTTVNGSVNALETITGLNIAPGEQVDLTLQPLSLSQSSNSIQVSIDNPDVPGDDVPADNVTTFTRIFNSVTDDIPLRQNFDNNVANWTVFAENGQDKWQGITTNVFKNSLVYKSFSNEDHGAESWFVSPVLNLSRMSEGSLFFSTSYGRRLSGSESLKVLVSEDCGLTYNNLIFEKSGLDLANETTDNEWIPGDSTQWTTEYLSINDFVGKDKVRFAFVAENDNGNDLYLDNIEFFVEDNANPPRTTQLFTVYNSTTNPYEFYFVFNLPERQDAHLMIFNALGQVLVDSQLPETLNQTYTINLYGQSTGVYIARMQTPSLTSSSKVLIGR